MHPAHPPVFPNREAQIRTEMLREKQKRFLEKKLLT